MTGKTTLFVAAMVVSFVVACPGLAATESPPTEDVAKLEYVKKQISSAYFARQGGITALERLHELLYGGVYGGGRACDRAGETVEKIREKISDIENDADVLVHPNVLYVHARWLEHYCKTESSHEFYKDAADLVEDWAVGYSDRGAAYIATLELPIDAIYRHGKWLLDSMQTRAYASTWHRSDTFQEAIRLHLLAAHYAHPKAQFQLGELYSGNLHSEIPILYGQYKDEDQADSWYLASAAMGYRKAQDALKERQKNLNMEEEEWASPYWASPNGTAFYIAKNTLLTAAHVAKGCGVEDNLEKYLRLYERGGRLVPVKVDALDDHADLALLKLDQSAQDHQHVAQLGCAVPSGGRVFALGFPMVLNEARYWSVHPHVTGGVVSNERGYFGRNTTFFFSGPTAKGQSGGPIVDENFHVAGVVSHGVENFVAGESRSREFWKNETTNLNEAVSVNRIHALLKTSCDERRRESSLEVIKGSVRPLYCYYDAEGIVHNQKRWAAITNELADLSQIAE